MIALQTEITHLVIHHSASPRDTSFAEIDSWHRSRNPPFDMFGYHWLIEESGLLLQGRKTWQVGAHVGGQNTGKLGVCVAGDNTRVANLWVGSQIVALRALVAACRMVWQDIIVCGHGDLAQTECPGLDIKEVLDAGFSGSP